MTDFVQGQLRVRFRFGTLWPMLEIFRKLYLFTGSCRLLRRLFDYARGSTQNGKKTQLKIRAEFMTSVSYRPEVISYSFNFNALYWNIYCSMFTAYHFICLFVCLYLACLDFYLMRRSFYNFIVLVLTLLG